MIKSKLFFAYHVVKAHLEDKKTQKIILGTEILICILIFITLSGGKGVDWDEAFTHQLVRNNDVLGIIRGTATDVHPPLYYLIVKLFTTVFGYKFSAYTWASITAGIGCVIFLFSILGVYTQYFAVFPIVAAYAILLLYIILHKRWKKFIPFTVVCVLNIIFFIPWLRYASHQFQTSGVQQECVDGFHICQLIFLALPLLQSS